MWYEASVTLLTSMIIVLRSFILINLVRLATYIYIFFLKKVKDIRIQHNTKFQKGFVRIKSVIHQKDNLEVGLVVYTKDLHICSLILRSQV